MASLITTQEGFEDIVLKGLVAEFKANLEEKLREHAEKIIKDVATEVAKAMVMKIETFNNHRDGTIELHVNFNMSGQK